MLWNGQRVVLDMAIRALGHPLTTRYRPARPGLPGGLVPFLTPGPRGRADRLFAHAVEHYREGRLAAAFVQLGRAAHLLTDMACPVHAQGTVHMISDSFEWYVEGNAGFLETLPVPPVAARGRASELVEDLARQTHVGSPLVEGGPTTKDSRARPERSSPPIDTARRWPRGRAAAALPPPGGGRRDRRGNRSGARDAGAVTMGETVHSPKKPASTCWATRPPS